MLMNTDFRVLHSCVFTYQSTLKIPDTPVMAMGPMPTPAAIQEVRAMCNVGKILHKLEIVY